MDVFKLSIDGGNAYAITGHKVMCMLAMGEGGGDPRYGKESNSDRARKRLVSFENTLEQRRHSEIQAGGHLVAIVEPCRASTARYHSDRVPDSSESW